jgi:hypothetical protein
MNISICRKNNVVRLVLLSLFFLSIFLCKKVEAASVINGAMWSSTIGWIASGPGYQLTLGDNGNITGAAWSNNIGWVAFTSSDVSALNATLGVCPGNAGVSILPNGYLTGSARVIAAGNDPSKSWDGCISFDVGTGSNHPQYDATSGVFSGAAWGDTNVGWVALSGTGFGLNTFQLPTVYLSVVPTDPIDSGEGVTLHWYPTNTYPTGCTGAGPNGWAGSGKSGVTTDNTQTLSNITATSTYTIQCSGLGGTSSVASVTVNVKPPLVPPGSCSSSPATFANVGQLVTWTAVGGASPYKWVDGTTISSQTGPTYQVRYSTIGKKVVTSSGIPCTPVGGLPIINDPNFKPF